MQICAHVQGLYLLEVRLNGYENRDGKCVDSRCQLWNMNMHSCCDDFRKFEDCNLSDCACDSYFIFCLRTFGTVRQEQSYNCQENYQGTIVTSVNVDDGPINFTNKTVLGVENPFLLRGLTEDYNVSNELKSMLPVIYISYDKFSC